MKIGLEKEMLIFDDKFNPQNFKLEELTKNMYLDFSNNQIELITDVHQTAEELMQQMYKLSSNEKLMKNKIWPLSQPGLNNYEVKWDALSKEETEYRSNLAQKYGTDYMNISGIHFNFSFENMQTEVEYFNLLKKIYIYSPLILQFFAYTPLYQKGINDQGLKEQGLNSGLETSLSLRNSNKYGYLNEINYKLNYDNYQEYKKSIQKLIDQNILQNNKEIYSLLRMKETATSFYLEMRYLDLNPFQRLGITIDDLKFLQLIIKYIKELDNLDLTTPNIYTALQNFEEVSLKGLDKNLKLNINGQNSSLKEHTLNLLENILADKTLTKQEKFIVKTKLNNYQKEQLDLNKFLNILKQDKLTIAEFGKQYAFQKEKFKPILVDKNLELSTKILIQAAENQKIKTEILDEYSNTVLFTKGNQKELVVQATKTNKDHYADVLMLENKIMTKQILAKNKINVPAGITLLKNEPNQYEKFKNKKTVVKPLDTNFGLGISILNPNFSLEEYQKSLDFAFKYSSSIIVEEFFSGIEYRFLVINNEVVSVLNRIPANVVGDGKKTIKELVSIKNQSELRNKGYITPLELIELGEFEKNFLANQKLDENSIPLKDQKVFLRENSNISTGGDSLEVSELIPDYFKEIAKEATKAMNAKICGIDMMIDEEFANYMIIEANFNPAIHIHTYPYLGLGKQPAQKVLNLLFR